MKGILLMMIVIYAFTTCFAFGPDDSDYYHLECGRPPTHSYRELAKSIGNLTLFQLKKS